MKYLLRLIVNGILILLSLLVLHWKLTIGTMNLMPITSNVRSAYMIYSGLIAGQGWLAFIFMIMGLAALITLINYILDRLE